MSVRQKFFLISFIVIALIIACSLMLKHTWWVIYFAGPIIILGMFDAFQTKRTIRRNFPIIGNFRYMLEAIRPEIMQYFVETDTQGRPFNRLFRSLVYQRAKNVNDTNPFGTQFDVYRTGYEWLNHSIYPKIYKQGVSTERVLVGGSECTQPYSASLLNISAMSYGSLSKNAIMALNKGAKMGDFAHNTGEGSISPFHLKYGGDLIWQIGTGYFGCRTKDGGFDIDKFEKKSQLPNVKMIEIKLSQGAKPGHGGILPAIKNTEEIAEIRGVQPHTDVMSPPFHRAFSDNIGLLNFVKTLRKKSGGKPIGFKLCLGRKEEFFEICQDMIKTGIKPDFITIDGGEGGTGAAPVEFSNSLGMPLREALAFAYNTLDGFDLKKDIKLIASGKAISSFHVSRLMALGADMVNMARGMMLALGCIQALQCNKNTCPVGVATQNKELMGGLVVKDKSVRIANFHKKTIHTLMELLAAAGFNGPEKLTRKDIFRRVSMTETKDYSVIFPYIKTGCLLSKETAPEQYKMCYK
jgi:glutamate synthase domain-containing protein 2